MRHCVGRILHSLHSLSRKMQDVLLGAVKRLTHTLLVQLCLVQVFYADFFFFFFFCTWQSQNTHRHVCFATSLWVGLAHITTHSTLNVKVSSSHIQRPYLWKRDRDGSYYNRHKTVKKKKKKWVWCNMTKQQKSFFFNRAFEACFLCSVSRRWHLFTKWL